MTALPELALSVRQPWAWAIIYGGKPIENRSWQAVNHGLRQRGRVCIHAAKGMTQDEYRYAVAFMLGLGPHSVRPPAPHLLARGCIIGTVEVVDVVSAHASPWFMGPRGLVLRDPEPLPEPIPAAGALGYFKWKAAGPEIMPAPARWMLPAVEAKLALPECQEPAREEAPTLFDP